MKILILNGSPRPNGNTAKLVQAFCEGAKTAGHETMAVNVCQKTIRGCTACEYCHGKGHGQCILKDDMQEVYPLLLDADALVLASPIYYHGFSGQLKCAIDRFYACAFPTHPPKLKKIAMLLSAGAPSVFKGAIYSFKEDFLGYLGLENGGIVAAPGILATGSPALKQAYELGVAMR